MLQSFIDLGVAPKIASSLEEMGFEEPTEVQSQAIPKFLAGKDIIVQAQTGTGKTAAYGIPIIQKIESVRGKVQALILSPTRELALQVAEHLNKIGRGKGLETVPIYGGASYFHQERALQRGCQIVVATPGRLLDLVNKRILILDQVKMVVLDEADEMLDMGFAEDVESILKLTPTTRQTALFSATMPQSIQRLAKVYLKEPERISPTQAKSVTVSAVEQSYCMVLHPFKTEALVRILDISDPELALVFSATKQMAAQLAVELQQRGYKAEALHGDMTQIQREQVMESSRKGRLDVLVATDVAARGLDVPEVTHVINFDIPQDPERYIHRIGRTARAGRSGAAITIVIPQEFSLLRGIERAIGKAITRKELPTIVELEEREREHFVSKLERTLLDSDSSAFRSLAEKLGEQHDVVDVAAAAMHMAFGPMKPRKEIPKVQARPQHIPNRYEERSGRRPFNKSYQNRGGQGGRSSYGDRRSRPK